MISQATPDKVRGLEPVKCFPTGKEAIAGILTHSNGTIVTYGERNGKFWTESKKQWSHAVTKIGSSGRVPKEFACGCIVGEGLTALGADTGTISVFDLAGVCLRTVSAHAAQVTALCASTKDP
jgi:hypothetical protein